MPFDWPTCLPTYLPVRLGSFEFLLTPAANAKLDREWIVIGQVVDAKGMQADPRPHTQGVGCVCSLRAPCCYPNNGRMQVLARLNSLPTNNYDQTPLALVKVERAVPLPGGSQ